MRRSIALRLAVLALLAADRPASLPAQDIKQTELYTRIKASVDAVPAIDTHDHLQPFERTPFLDKTDRGTGMTLHGVWRGSYYTWIHPLTPWPEGKSFDDWWPKARGDFDNARATSFYRYMLPGFRDLYGVDFDTITDEQARALNDQIFAHYQDDKWLREVVTERANIELMFIDPHWARFKFERAWPFAVIVLNVTTMVDGTHPSRIPSALNSPYVYAEGKGRKIESLDDYVATLDTIFADASAAGAVCLKSTLAYQRTLRFENVSKERAQAGFGKRADELTPQERADFEDYVFWRIVELSAKYELPFQIHTGQARIQGSNPMLLVDLIEANPKTKFILFHGGFPWVGETGVIAMRFENVWIDSVWLPTLSYTMGKRAYQEWLEVMPSNRIMWGADTACAEGIYAATEFTRQCLAEALAEKAARGELREEHALRIGRQIMRDNALELFPRLKPMLWRKGGESKSGS